jgi:ABC-type lipoprotein export system ATPase subunit
MSFFEQAIITPKTVSVIKDLVFDDKDKEILSWLQKVSFRSILFGRIVFVFTAVYSFLSTIFLVMSRRIVHLEAQKIYWIFAFYVAVGLVNYFLAVFGAWRNLNTYMRIISTTFDNILESIFDNYVVSLAHITPKFPRPKTFSTQLSAGALGDSNYQTSVSSIFGIFVGVIFGLVYGIFWHDWLSLSLSIFGLVAVLLFAIFMNFGRRYIVAEEKLHLYADSLDRNYMDRRSTIFSRRNEINLDELESVLASSVNLTTWINAINYFATSVLPILLMFFPYLFDRTATSFALGASGLFILSKIFRQASMAGNYNSKKIAQVRLKQIDEICDIIKRESVELTPERYDVMRAKLGNSGLRSQFSSSNNNLRIENRSFVVGRGKERRMVSVGATELESGKVHFLFGRSGAGKSIFGRVLTLRYAAFRAKRIEVGGKDIRSFDSLFDGLSVLHFSSLRHITTSYRNAISVYISNPLGVKGIVDYINLLKPDSKSIKSFFAANCSYYGKIARKISCTNIPEIVDEIRNFDDKDLRRIALVFKERRLKDVSNKKDLEVLAVLEFASFKYLKAFIPEANLYFMDAFLSEPPISQGQRRRIILALDLLTKGRLLMADEPFANLDDKNAKEVLKLLVNYARLNNVVVLVLDQKDRISLKDFTDKTSLGKVLSISGDTIREV